MPLVTKTRDVEVTKELGTTAIKLHRPKFIYFEFTGLRPSAPHWIFFGKIEVTKFVNTSYSKTDITGAGRNSVLKEPGEKFIKSNQFPSGGGLPYGGPTAQGGSTDPLFTNSNGILKGVFYLQSNSLYKWSLGPKHELLAIDILSLKKRNAYSYATAYFKGKGEYENYWKGIEQETYEVWEDPPPPPKNNSRDDKKTYVVHSNGTITQGTGIHGQETYNSFHEAAVAKNTAKRKKKKKKEKKQVQLNSYTKTKIDMYKKTGKVIGGF